MYFKQEKDLIKKMNGKNYYNNLCHKKLNLKNIKKTKQNYKNRLHQLI